MKLTRTFLLIVTTFLAFNTSISIAADSTGKTSAIADWEKQKIAEEFNQYFQTTDKGAFQKLNRNPWSSKRARQLRQEQKVLKISASMDSCQAYSVKQRRQCYAKGNSAGMCERYFKARMDHCSEYF